MWKTHTMRAIRATAALLLFVFAPAFVAPTVLQADEEGGCKADSGSGCITQNGAYSGKYCASGACITCSVEPGSVCSYCKDLEDYYNGSSTSCES
jgi:hypothetical protein